MNIKPKKILITGARSPIALDLARQLNALGHEVYVAETHSVHICRFSKAVKKSFLLPSPRFQQGLYVRSLAALTCREKIDFLIPTWEEVFTISKHLHFFPSHCTVFTSPFKTINPLRNKWLFSQKLKKHGFDIPTTFLIKNRYDLEKIEIATPLALKPCYVKHHTKVCKIRPGNDYFPRPKIEKNNPWIAQEWIEGKKFCTYSICHEGEIRAHTTYPMNIAMSESSCLNFKSIDHRGIFNWIQRFVYLENYTGQIAFDFIETAEKKLYAIECNPRATSGLFTFHPENQIDKAFFNTTSELITPSHEIQKQIMAGVLIYGWKQKKQVLRNLLNHKDVVFHKKDLKPFLSMPLIFSRYLYQAQKLGLPVPAFFNHDLDWDSEFHTEDSSV